MPNAKINDADYYYELHGKGPALILIAGYCCDHQLWLPILDNLSKYFQVLIFDNRGIGLTKDAGQTLSAELMADDLMSLCQELNIKQPHVLGHSMGGTIAQAFAAKYPKNINKLAIICSSAKWRQAMLRGLKSLLDMREQEINFDLIFNSMLPWVFGENFLNNKQNIDLLKRMYLQDPNPQSIPDQARQFAVLEKFDGREQLKNISAPTLIMHGTEDIISLQVESLFMENQIPNALYVPMSCAHAIALELPQAFTDEIIHFFRA